MAVLNAESYDPDQFAELFGKVSKASTKGRAAQAGGKGFEADLELAHEAYRDFGIADVYRLPVDTQPMPPGWLMDPTKRGIARILARRQRSDYAGVLKGGRSIVMEAKACATTQASIPILAPDGKGFGLKAHQLKALAEAHRYGALAGLVWRNGHGRYVCPGRVLSNAWAVWAKDPSKLKRLSRDTMVPYEVRDFGAFPKIEDWLHPLLKAPNA